VQLEVPVGDFFMLRDSYPRDNGDPFRFLLKGARSSRQIARTRETACGQSDPIAGRNESLDMHLCIVARRRAKTSAFRRGVARSAACLPAEVT